MENSPVPKFQEIVYYGHEPKKIRDFRFFFRIFLRSFSVNGVRDLFIKPLCTKLHFSQDFLAFRCILVRIEEGPGRTAFSSVVEFDAG